MAVSAKISALTRFISANPALADVPFAVVRGVPITPREALARLQRGEMVSEIMSALARAGFDPQPPELWRLAEEYYRQLARKAPGVKVVIIGVGEFTYEQLAQQIRLRTPLGRMLVQQYQALLREMAKRMR